MVEEENVLTKILRTSPASSKIYFTVPIWKLSFCWFTFVG